MTRDSLKPRPWRGKALFLAFALTAAVAGCRDLTGDALERTGAVEITVKDQAGTPLFDVTVAIARKNDIETLRTANNGVVRFDLVEVGDRVYSVVAPEGYTGGGEQNARTVTVVEGQVTKDSFTLTKTP